MTIQTNGKSFEVHAWTGGNTAPKGEYSRNPVFRGLIHAFYRSQVRECGGLGLWACAGTTAMERARIFWNRARHDAWRTWTEAGIKNRNQEWQELVKLWNDYDAFQAEIKAAKGRSVAKILEDRNREIHLISQAAEKSTRWFRLYGSH